MTVLGTFRLAALSWVIGAQACFAQTFDTRATAAYVFDQTTGTVLLTKNEETPLPPASMSKLMTIYMAFEAITDGRLVIDELLPVSTAAAAYGCLLYTSPSPRDKRQSRMPSSA